MNKNITPVRLLLLVAVIGGICHFWPSHDPAASPSGPSETTVRETPKHKPQSNPGTAAGAVAQLEGNASFSKVPPPRPTDTELNKILQTETQQ